MNWVNVENLDFNRNVFLRNSIFVCFWSFLNAKTIFLSIDFPQKCESFKASTKNFYQSKKTIQNVNPTDLRDQTHGSIAWIDRAGLQTCQILELQLKDPSSMTSRKQHTFPANIYLFKVNNRNIRKRCEICSTLTIKTTEQHH